MSFVLYFKLIRKIISKLFLLKEKKKVCLDIRSAANLMSQKYLKQRVKGKIFLQNRMNVPPQI